MNDPFQLVTNCNFKGKDYLVQMCVSNSKKLELIITDKILAEDWQCEYDASYIEALTHKTGNFKQFDVFVMMLKSGLLKTSDCITLDLLTIEDLEQLRCKKILNSHSSSRTSQSLHLNKRYLILTYSVEFDRIHYPLPLDYCGPPDPTVLQSNIRRLEGEIERLKQKNNLLTRNEVGDVKKLKEKNQCLLEENNMLTNEIHRLNKIISKRAQPMKNGQIFLNSLKKLEEEVLHEKTRNQKIIMRLKSENKKLKQQMEELKRKEKEKLEELRLKDASRYGRQKFCKKILRNSLSPENSLNRKRSATCNRVDSQLSCRPVSSWNNSSVAKPCEVKALRKPHNRFLSSSSSESEDKQPHIARSREKKFPPRQSLSSKRGGSYRKSSHERSRHSSEDSQRKVQSHRSRLTAGSQEGKAGSLVFIQATKSQTGERSRESSLSSRGSSKHSKLSRFSNRGSGDCLALKKMTPRAITDDKEDLKFTMSDLEARIHSLQRLLNEGLHF